MSNPSPDLVIVGSIGLDTIETPADKRENILGGSVSYAAAAASFSSNTGMVGVVGTDFPDSCIDLYRRFGINLEGLQTADGETFKWHGVYEANMNNRETLNTELNVFADFHPQLPESYTHAPYLFLANIAPELQLHVLDQAKNVKFTAADTMDLWINIAHDKLLEVISRVDLLTINDSESWLLTEKHNPVHAAQWILERGPKYVIIKKGEHGAMLVTADEVFIIPAYPVDQVMDPTGAGDTFAGGLMGTLAKDDDFSEPSIRKGMLNGSVLASFGVEKFSLENLDSLDQEKINARCEDLRRMCHIPV